MTLGSLFDGSGGFPLAGIYAGLTPLWASEVEPYPIAVTRSRFPKMKNLGNVMDVKGGGIKAALEKALHRASPWHSVKDGLPDSGTFCVVRGYNESGEAHHDIACKIGAGWANWGLNSFKVTHWMPLPEAPKEGDE